MVKTNTMFIGLALITLFMAVTAQSQTPAVEPGVSHDLAKWRAAHYSDVRYKLNLTLEKMSPVLKGSIEIRVNVSAGTQAPSPANDGSSGVAALSEPGAIATGFPIVLDWRKIKGHEERSTIANVLVNGEAKNPVATAPGSDTEHLVFSDGVVAGENVITLDFTSPILTSGSAITRYIDKEDGSEYIYSLFVPSDASTAFPVFDQPDLKAVFTVYVSSPPDWRVISNGMPSGGLTLTSGGANPAIHWFGETKPISTYVFAFAAGPWERVSSPTVKEGAVPPRSGSAPSLMVGLRTPETSIYVRRSQAAKFQPHAAEVFRLNREAVKYFEGYFDYKFPFPKYDIVLIPEFPFGGMEHAGATFLREASIIFPQEPTKSDHISRAVLIFHEAAHQWFGDTVTMKWFDDLWLKEGFANFMAYKALEKIKLGGGNPTGREGVSVNLEQVDAWKVFYERIKQPAYATDSTKGTTPIYQEIPNLSAAKSAYGNIVYNKAPAFLKQAEFYLGPDKFQTAVRAFLKKHEYKNANWEDLVTEFEASSGKNLKNWANSWIKQKGVATIRVTRPTGFNADYCLEQSYGLDENSSWNMKVKVADDRRFNDRHLEYFDVYVQRPLPKADRTYVERQLNKTEIPASACVSTNHLPEPEIIYPNYQDYGYGIFLLDDKSREYVLKNIQSEKDPFLRSMMYGALWDSVREAELDPRTFVELAIKNLSVLSASFSLSSSPRKEQAKACTLNCGETDETIIQSLLSRVATAVRYYLPADAERVSSPHVSKGAVANSTRTAPSLTVGLQTRDADDVQSRLEALLIDRMQHAPTPGLRITFYRSFLNLASSDNARNALKQILAGPLKGNPRITPLAPLANGGLPTLRTKDKFDIVTRLMILGDTDAPRLLAALEKTETSDDAKRYAYAARAGMATAENKAKYWSNFVGNKEISESWIEAAFGPFNSVRHSELTLPYLEKALAELSNHKRSRKIFFVNGWLAAFIGGQRSEQALATINKFLDDNPNLDKDLRLKILENVDIIERAVRIRQKY